jgi:mono/diheme cytochrome c family protein
MQSKTIIPTLIIVTLTAILLVLYARDFISLRTHPKGLSEPIVPDAQVDRIEDQEGASPFAAETLEPAADLMTTVQDGPSIIKSQCTRCHGNERFDPMEKPRPEWEDILKQMEAMGAHLSEPEKKALLDYLAPEDQP